MNGRFADLRKIPKSPARRLMALCNLKFETPLDLPAAAPVDVVLAELWEKKAHGDILRLLAAALPAREAIWWSCLAAEDLLAGPDVPKPPPLAAARAWVFKPTDENREKARQAVEAAENDDETTLCATAVAMHDGKLAGSGDLAAHDAPAGIVALAALGMNAKAIGAVPHDEAMLQLEHLINRGLDIARGGNGQIERPAPPPQDTPAAAVEATDEPEDAP